MENVTLTIHLILALLLIGVVLLQRSEGGGMGLGAGGGGGGMMSGRAAASALTRVTWVLAVMFICTSLTLTILAARNVQGSSVVEQIGAGSGNTAPDGSNVNDLLPPAPQNAPLTPPKAEY